MEKFKKIEDLFKAKEARRKELAKLPIEEKVRILVKLQKLAIPILKSRGIKKEAWKL
ncbi:MAG: hypothetical protein KDK66_04735 [Deltaproteobacteria bacterium]|nr:hypothetical protein [Deltaproteobacteria bacterium]